MFDIAWSELLLIAVIALIFIGPKELPHVLHSLGRMTAKLRRSADDFRRQFEDSVREAGYEDLHKNIQEFRSLNPAGQLKDSIARAINQEYTPSPATPASPLRRSRRCRLKTKLYRASCSRLRRLARRRRQSTRRQKRRMLRLWTSQVLRQLRLKPPSLPKIA